MRERERKKYGRVRSACPGEELGGSSWHLYLLFPLFCCVFSFKSLTQRASGREAPKMNQLRAKLLDQPRRNRCFISGNTLTPEASGTRELDERHPWNFCSDHLWEGCMEVWRDLLSSHQAQSILPIDAVIRVRCGRCSLDPSTWGGYGRRIVSSGTA